MGIHCTSWGQSTMACSFTPVASTPSLLRHAFCPQSHLVDSLSSTHASTIGAPIHLLKTAHHRSSAQHLRVQCKASPEKTAPTAESSLPVKAAWYASEAFGQAVAAFRPKKDKEDEEEVDEAVLPLSHEEVVALLRADYDRSYFVTGQRGRRQQGCVSFQSLAMVQNWQYNVHRSLIAFQLML